MTKAIAIVTAPNPYERIAQLAQDGVNSPKSKRAYGDALAGFLQWCNKRGKTLDKATVQNYKSVLQSRGFAPATINQHLSAIRKLATEAEDNGLIESHIANGIARVKGIKAQGVRTGNWLTKAQAQKLVNAPDIETLKGLRDRAILAVLIGAGLRRSEAAALTFAHIQQREGRWVIVDLVGKHNRVRSVPIHAWTKVALDAWAKKAEIHTGRIFRSINKAGVLTGETLTSQAIQDVVKLYAPDIAAHDLRRTFAKLSHKGGAAMEQIQLSLGHANIKTTQDYLNIDQELTDAPCDHLGLDLEA